MANTVYMSPISLIIQYFTNLGLIAAGASVYTYAAGTVNTLAATYSDSTGTVQNPNPLTLNAAGRPTAPGTGAPVAFWNAPGIVLKLVVLDAQGNTLIQLDQISAINDPTNVSITLANTLLSPANSNTAGVGPAGGVDFVANAVKSYDVFADVRSANEPTPAVGQTINIEVQGGTAINDGLGGFFYWSTTSTATDDGRTVLKPSVVPSAQPGRWLRWYPLGVPQVINKTTDQLVASSTVLVNDTQLQATLLPNATYLLSLRALLLGTGGTGQGWKIAIAYGGTLNGNATTGGGGTMSGNGNASVSALYATLNNAFGQAAISSTTGDFANCDIIIQTATGGSLNVQFAQNSSSSNATAMKAGSTLSITRVA